MQHDVDEEVLQAFSSAHLGPPVVSSFGLSIATVLAPFDEQVRAPAMAEALIWEEVVPAHPRRVRARNPSGARVVVDPGILLNGGRGTRVVAQTTVVPPGAEAIAEVETVDARWWDEGPLRAGPRLMPIAMAVVLQAVYGRGPSASSARTALWSLPELDGTADVMPAFPSGWVLLEHDRVLAGWVAERARLRRSETPSGPRGPIAAALRRGLHSGTLVGHALDHPISGREWIVVPTTYTLVDAVAGVSMVTAA